MSVFESKTSRLVTSIVTLAAIAFAAGCGEETELSQDAQATVVDVVPVVPPMASYSGPGSNWEYDLHDDGTYQVLRSAVPGMASDLVVDGSYQSVNGFLSMTVDAASGADAPAVGSTAWALEIPDFALFLSPISSSDDNFIPMIEGSDCPNTDMSSNWITVRANASGDATSTSGSYFGSLQYKHNDGNTSLSSQFALTGGNPDQGFASLGNGYCQDGVVKSASSDIYLSPNGGSTVHANAADDDGGYFIFAQPKSTIGSVVALDGSYSGALSDDGAEAGEKVSPVLVTCTSGICSGDFVTDIASGALAGQPFTLDLSGTINEPGTGLTTGQLFMNGTTGNVGCMVDENLNATGRRMISCAGQSPTRSYRLFNVILSSND